MFRQLLQLVRAIGYRLSGLSAYRQATKLEVPPEIRRRHLPAGAPFDTVVRGLRDWLVDVRRQQPELTMHTATSQAELLADCQREVRRKHEHRRGIGWLTETEFKRFAPSGATPERVDAIYAEIKRLVAKLPIQSTEPGNAA